jgi:hypothetical protein
VYDSRIGACDGVYPTYNSIKIGPVNNDTTYDHTSNIVQKQVNSDTTYGGLPKNAIRNNTAENTSTGGERQNSTYFSSHEYAVVVKKHPAGPAAEPLNRNESGRFGALKSDSTHHFFRNACTKSGSLRFSQFSGC